MARLLVIAALFALIVVCTALRENILQARMQADPVFQGLVHAHTMDDEAKEEQLTDELVLEELEEQLTTLKDKIDELLSTPELTLNQCQNSRNQL